MSDYLGLDLDLNLSIPRGQIVALLGANGCGKSTTLDSIAGLQGFSNGKVTIDASGGVGVAPQKNVLWDELTVREHVRLFNRIKAPFQQATEQELNDLLQAVGLVGKKDAKSATLSGGQKRKLQLAMMLTGGQRAWLGAAIVGRREWERGYRQAAA
ncbi:P-loop containing nucleoside triphosphate hydrolase protein [Dactylonectria estremocensis]|uniref:P-loop containing nucleoside triphosphate hydrolase protein n=1 Tax=Dactylonectria estremocensis TaxID=1079267 RepID=A0A9P9CZ97_9HYPO|nr:P-loop containing nucleoside triphosphate hydrolase protein [Dactylonectria estremocensis]